MELKKTMFKLKATMVAVLMATSSSINAIDADVKTDLLARYPNMNTLSDAQLQKVVNLFHRFPGLKTLIKKTSILLKIALKTDARVVIGF